MNNRFVHRYRVDFQDPRTRKALQSLLMDQDEMSDVFILDVFDGKEPVTLEGTAKAFVQRGDGNEVEETGTISGNVITIPLSAHSYYIPGVVIITIKLITSGATNSLIQIEATVRKSHSGNTIDPTGETIIRVEEVFRKLDNAEEILADVEAATEDAEAAAQHSVRFDEAQTTTAEQKLQARKNLGLEYPVASAAELAELAAESETSIRRIDGAEERLDADDTAISKLQESLRTKAEANDLHQVAYETDAAHTEILEIKKRLETKADLNGLSAVAAKADIRMTEAERQLSQKAEKNDLNAVAADCDLLRQHVVSETDRLDQKIIADENQISELFGDIADQTEAIAFKVNKPSGNGTNGQVLKTNGDGTTDWTDPSVPTDEQIENAVTDWLDDHPEATTTVEDGSITMAKLDSDLQDAITSSTESQDTETAISAMDISDSVFRRCSPSVESELQTVKRYEHKLRQYAGRFTSADGFGLLFFTDPHTLSSKFGATEYVMRSELESIGQVYRNTAAHVCICGGDWQNEGETLPEALWQLAKVPNEMRHYIGERAYTVVGNHEGNGESAGQLMLTPEKMARLWYDSNDGWFCIDTQVCRIVMFDAGYSIRPLTDYQYREIDWFGNLLVENQIDHIICVGHILGKTDGANLGDALTQMMDAFNKRNSIMINGETYDFSQPQCKGTVHFCLSGHYHADDNIVLNNIPIVFTDDYATSRAIDCCYVDFATSTLHCDRIGNGADRTFAIIPTGGYKTND